MERRNFKPSKSSPLPKDYLVMVKDVFLAHFADALKQIEGIKPGTTLDATGEIYADEVVLRVSLLIPGSLAATTVHASVDYDPKASVPSVQDLLASCVDAIASAYEKLLDPNDPEALAQVVGGTLAEIEIAPLVWTQMEINQRPVFVKVDKANPKLDGLADAWLAKNDPDHLAREMEEYKQTEELFVTGPKKPKKV